MHAVQSSPFNCVKGDAITAYNLLFYQLLLVALALICFLMHVWWPDNPSITPQTLRRSDTPRHKRSTEPKPFTGFLHKPLCDACEQGADARPQTSGSAPPVLTFSRGRRRTVDTHAHFCPDPECVYYGRLGRGNLRANGHPCGQPWRQLQCVACQGYFSEMHGPIFYEKRSSGELLVRVLACLAEGLGIRGTARVFEVDRLCCMNRTGTALAS